MFHKQIATNINIKIPEEGEKIKRLVEIAKERNIDYKPSAEAMQSLMDYIDRKGIPNPLGDKFVKPLPINNIPTYNPDPNMYIPPPN